jgi:hypothetical protein
MSTSLEVLQMNLDGFSASLVWLRRSYERCVGIGIKTDYTEIEFDYFENLTSRYARTTDLLVNKVLRSIDTVEFVAKKRIFQYKKWQHGGAFCSGSEAYRQ